MLNFIFSLIRIYSLPILYIGGLVICIISLFKKPIWGIYLLIVLVPQPNIFYKLYDFPFGKDFLDILFFSALAGLLIFNRKIEFRGNTALIIILILVNYIALWNSSINFNLPYPISTENPMLKSWKNYSIMLMMYVLSYYSLKNNGKEHRNIILIITMVILFISLRSYRSFSPRETFVEDSRASGPFWIVGLGSNHFGAFITNYCSILLGIMIFEKNKWRKLLFLGTIIIGIHPLFFSYSRGSYLAALLVIIFFGILKSRILLLLAFLILLAWNIILPTSVIDRIKMTKSESGELEQSASARLMLWDHAIDIFKKNPIFGTGFGSFEYSLPEGIKWKDTHNYYLKILSEQGIIGFSLLLIILLKAFKSGWKLFKIRKNDFEGGIGLGFMGCVISMIATNLFGDRWSYLVLGSYFWFFWGLVDSYLITIKDLGQKFKKEPSLTKKE